MKNHPRGQLMSLWVKTPHTGSGTSFMVPCNWPTFCQPELWKGNLGSRWGGLSTAFSSFLVTFPPFSVHSWVGWRPGTFTFSCFPRRGVYMRPRQSYPVFAAWGGQAGWAVPSAGWRATLLGTVFPLGCSCSQQDRGWHRAGVGVGACLLFLCFRDKQV